MKWIKRIGCAVVVIVVASAIYVAINDSGIISVHYADSKNPEHQQIKKGLEDWRGFAAAADELDAAFMVPRDLQIVFSDCGHPNAAYDPSQSAIFMCYELVNQLIRSYRGHVRTDSALAAAVWQTTFFVFYHEIGHALIDVLDLPTTGREEDAVDQLATIVLLGAGPAGRDAALRGAQWFLLNARTARRRLSFWDEHSLDQQRFYNIVCWVYGSDPEAHKELLAQQWGLPRERAERCPAEYDHMSRAWESVLSSHMH